MRPEERENQRYKKDDHCKITAIERKMFEILENWVKNSRENKRDIKVLDIGCGSGLITREIKKLGYQVNGLDFSEEAVKKAVLNGIEAKICDLDKGISENSSEFDVIWAGDIIEHVFDPINLLKEANRILRPNGIIILSVPNDVSILNRLRMLLGISYQEKMYKKSGFYKHHTFFNLKLIKYMLEKNNLKIININKFLEIKNYNFSSSFLPSIFYNEIVLSAKKQ